MTADNPDSLNMQVPPQRGAEFAGARHMRRLTARTKWTQVIEDTAVAVYDCLAGDWAADSVEIGRMIKSAADKLGGKPVTSKVIESLASRLEVPECRLRQCLDVFAVAELFGEDALSRRLPVCSFEVLISLSPVIKTDLMPWRKREILLRIVDSVVRYGFDRERIESLVQHLLVKDVANPPSQLVAPNWFVPTATAKKPRVAVNADAHKAA